MLNKIDAQAATPTSRVQPALQPPVSRATQIEPAQSVLDLAQSELEASASNWTDMSVMLSDIQSHAVTETLEDIGFALGSRLRDPRRANTASDGKIERPRARSMLQRLAQQISAISPAQLDDLHHRLPDLEDMLDPDQAMREAGFDAGEQALLLASLLADKGISGARRKRLEAALATVMDNDEWALCLFSRLEFGSASRQSLNELRQLYQRAATRQTRLVQWFAEFRRLQDRQRKLKTLIRALAFELSANGPALETHLGAVITDLKRILHFLSLDDHCQRMAQSLNLNEVDGDTLIEDLLEIVQQTWLQSDWLAARTQQRVPDSTRYYSYARHLAELVKLIPDDCFDESDQREMILNAFTEYLTQLAE
ncbi:MAG: type III secretion regulator YopN/LcrE/InvE/MxiC [Glomeribacter sp. 1016415]|nr:type III secretion regulator YopN/LcrE/InvE/MxiC [Glomeribacter sp. 1016415]